VELMETLIILFTENEMKMKIASIIGSGINGNFIAG